MIIIIYRLSVNCQLHVPQLPVSAKCAGSQLCLFGDLKELPERVDSAF